jgi:hypothetical protein
MLSSTGQGSHSGGSASECDVHESPLWRALNPMRMGR